MTCTKGRAVWPITPSLTREDTDPLCPLPLPHIQTGGGASVCNSPLWRRFQLRRDIWSERAAMRSCTGYWYNSYNIAEEVKTLENQQLRDQPYCITKWEQEKWTDWRRMGRTSAHQRGAVFVNFVENHSNTHWGLITAM
jgi:hypothetical protein